MERFAKQFQVQFEGILEYKSYMKMHMRGETAKNGDKLAAMEHRMRGACSVGWKIICSAYTVRQSHRISGISCG